MEEFKDFLVNHDYYCSDTNYYSNSATVVWGTWSDFYNDYKDADIDLNLIFRWDIKEKEHGEYYMNVFIIHQRKGIFAPQIIENIDEKDFDSIKELLSKHYDKLVNLWNPFSKTNDRKEVQP